MIPSLTAPSLYQHLPPLVSLTPFREDVEDMITGALSVAVNTIGSNDPQERKKYVQKTGAGTEKKKWKAHRMLFVYGAEETGGFGFRWIVGMASFFFGSLSAPLTGHDLSLRRFAATELARVDEELNTLRKFTQYLRHDKVAKALTEMLFHERKVFVILKRNAEIALTMRIILLITALMGFVGAVGVLPNVLVIGAAGMFFTASVMLLKTGFDSSAFQVRREAHEMRRYIDYLRRVNWLTGTWRLSYPLNSLRH